jgi:thiol-disulfide isomerase/thioredoxin
MKPIRLIMVVCVLAILSACHQQPASLTISALTISNATPTSGEEIHFTYKVDSGQLAGDTGVQVAILYPVKNNFYTASVPASDSGNVLQGSFIVPDSTEAFALRFKSGDSIDINKGNGYVFTVYKDGKPMPGGYAAASDFHNAMGITGAGGYELGLKPNADTALSYLQNEFKLYPDSKAKWNMLYLYDLVVAKKDSAQAAIDQAFRDSLKDKTTSEATLTKFRYFYQLLHQPQRYNPITKIITKRYPDGQLATTQQLAPFYKLQDPDSMAMMLEKYLPALKKNSTPDNDLLSMVYTQLAVAYAKQKNYDQFKQAADKVTNNINLAFSLNNIAWENAQKAKDVSFDDTLSMSSLDMMQQQLDSPSVNKPTYITTAEWKNILQQDYSMFADTYGFILSKEGKNDEALAYQEKVIDLTKGADPDEDTRYVQYLLTAGKADSAMTAAAGFIKNGESSGDMLKFLKQAYIKKTGSDKNFEAYADTLQAAATAKMKTDLAKQMIDQPEKPFSLTDLKGNTVTLDNLKGKVVVVDFWATWCSPCKASFPGMQETINKFKNNPDVVFLFVDTWEQTTPEVRQKQVADFIKDNKYTFHVLLDKPEPNDSTQFQVVNAYGVKGIPTKFIIDPNGNIRFMKVGYDGSTDGLVKELSLMINMVKG